MLFLSPMSLDLPHPTLADAYGAHPAPIVAVLRVEDGGVEASSSEDVVISNEVDERKFIRHRRIARSGTHLMAGGVALVVASGVVLVGGGVADGRVDGPFVWGSLVMLGAGSTAWYVGEGLMFGGGILAADDAHRLGARRGSGLGWAGLGLVSGGLVLGGLAGAAGAGGASTALAGFAGATTLAGLGCGVAQVVQVNGFARDHHLSLVVLPDRVQIAGRF